MLENLAEAFDLPDDNPDHEGIRNFGWHGGPNVEGRYFLGKLLGSNEFRFTHELYDEHLRECLKSHLSQAKWLLDSRCFQEVMTCWLIHQYRQGKQQRRFPIVDATKEEEAIVRVLEVPNTSDDQIQSELDCTEQTMKRWSSFQLLRIEQRRLAPSEQRNLQNGSAS